MSDAQTATALHPISLPLEAQLEIDAACQQFEQAWRAGQQPQLEEFVARAREDLRGVLQAELAIAARDLIETQCGVFAPKRAASPDETQEHLPADTNAALALNKLDWSAGSSTAVVPSPPGYELLEELGRGGMGVVYKARQTGLNRRPTAVSGRQSDRDNQASHRHRGSVAASAECQRRSRSRHDLHEVPGEVSRGTLCIGPRVGE